MRGLKRSALFSFLLLLAAIAITLVAQPIDARDDSVVDVMIGSDLSAEISGRWQRPIRPLEIDYYFRGQGIMLHPFVVYQGNVTLSRDEAGELRGTYCLRAAPIVNPRKVSPTIISELHAQGYLSKTRIQRLLLALYGGNVSTIYGIKPELGSIDVSSLVYGNLTLTTLEVESSITTRAELIRSLDLSFEASMSGNAFRVFYRANISTDPLPIHEEDSRSVLDLESVMLVWPNYVISTIRLNVTGLGLRVVGGSPQPNLVLPNYAEVFFVPSVEGATVLFYFEEVGRSIWFWILLSLSLVTPAALVVVFVKRKS